MFCQDCILKNIWIKHILDMWMSIVNEYIFIAKDLYRNCRMADMIPFFFNISNSFYLFPSILDENLSYKELSFMNLIEFSISNAA